MNVTPPQQGRAISLAGVRNATSLSAATIWRFLHDDPTFPRSFKLGSRTCWDEDEILAWVAAKKAASRRVAA